MTVHSRMSKVAVWQVYVFAELGKGKHREKSKGRKVEKRKVE